MRALRKVLVVDDDPVVGKSFNRVLSHDKGYVVITAQNAAEALERLREQEYDVVFTDIKMPGMDGVELTERVKASRPWTPVVIITGYGTPANEQRAKAAGVSDFMRKPLSPEMIEESATHALQPPATATASVVPLPAASAQAMPAEAIDTQHSYRNLAKLVAAPFVGLAYAVLLPLIGLAMLAWTALQALMTIPVANKILMRVKDIALFVAAPFIGLIYAVMLPVVGMTMLVSLGVKAWMTRKAKA
ncbi:MAG: response regulator [Rhodoferax sp.]|uniref:response regulator n=1 Tax=Rhodoferax sp. TaxID=50421 RepID=UPI003C788CB9